MVQDNVGPGARPSWHEREITQSLQRLANARANLAQLEEQLETEADRPAPDPTDLARAEELQVEINRLMTKASGRFGGGAARSRLEETRVQQRLVLERLGVESYEDLEERPAGAEPAVDPAVLDFARRECADAEKEFLEVAAMVIPEVEPGQDSDDADGQVIAAADSFTEDDATLDLRIEPSAAS